MDKFAKFIGYAVIILIVVGTLRYFGKQMTSNKEPVTKRDRCEEIETAKRVTNLVPTIIEKTGNFGTDIKNNISSCEYYSSSDTSLLSVSIGWNGPFTGDFYRMDGRLTLYPGKWEWETTGGNENLKGWQSFKVVTEAVADAMSESNLHFTNNCNVPIRMAVSYKDMSDSWQTVGWWEFDPGEKGLLMHNDKYLKTKTDDWYYYAEATDDSGWVWKGDYEVTFENKKYSMYKLTDGSANKSWATSCGQE